MPELKDTMGNRWLTALTIDDNINGVRSSDVINALEAGNIESRPVWKPLHLQPVFKNAAFFAESGDKSISSMLFDQGLCLPSGSGMTCEDRIGSWKL